VGYLLAVLHLTVQCSASKNSSSPVRLYFEPVSDRLCPSLADHHRRLMNAAIVHSKI